MIQYNVIQIQIIIIKSNIITIKCHILFLIFIMYLILRTYLNFLYCNLQKKNLDMLKIYIYYITYLIILIMP